MVSSVWKGYISFGLVSVPVRLFAAARESHVSFNQLHTPCGSRIKQQIVCPTCDENVERSDLSKSYEVEKDVYVTVTPEELKSLDFAASDTMNIEQFVSLKDVDPLYFQTSYYSFAEEPGRKAYTLLFQSMKRLNLAAIARVSMHSREQVVMRMSSFGASRSESRLGPLEMEGFFNFLLVRLPAIAPGANALHFLLRADGDFFCLHVLGGETLLQRVH